MSEDLGLSGPYDSSRVEALLTQMCTQMGMLAATCGEIDANVRGVAARVVALEVSVGDMQGQVEVLNANMVNDVVPTLGRMDVSRMANQM